MKQEIKKIVPHQNGKVFAILMAVMSLIFVVPIFLVIKFTVPETSQNIFSWGMIVFMPFFYLISTYVSVAICLIVYNFLFKYIGGFEYETKDNATNQ